MSCLAGFGPGWGENLKETPSAGLYKLDFYRAENCHSVHIKVHFYMKYNEQPKQRAELQKLSDLADLIKLKNQWQQQVAALKLEQLNIQKERSHYAYHVAVNASDKVQNELHTAEQALREHQTLNQHMLQRYDQQQEGYYLLDTYNQAIRLQLPLANEFHKAYRSVQKRLHPSEFQTPVLSCEDKPVDCTAHFGELPENCNVFIEPQAKPVPGGVGANVMRVLSVPPKYTMFPHTIALETHFDGHWNSQIERYPTTGVPVFQRDYYSQKTPVGRLRFYGTPLLCRDVNSVRTNIVEATGVGEPVMSEIQAALAEDPNVIENICEKLPPTERELFQASVKQGAENGAVRGIANTVGYAMKKYGIKEKTIHLTKELITYGFYFQSRLSAHCETDASSLEACGHAAMETAQFACISKACQLVDYLGQQTQKKRHGKYIGGALSFFSKLAPIAISVKQEGWIRTTAAVTTSLAVEQWVSEEGKNIVDTQCRRSA